MSYVPVNYTGFYGYLGTPVGGSVDPGTASGGPRDPSTAPTGSGSGTKVVVWEPSPQEVAAIQSFLANRQKEANKASVLSRLKDKRRKELLYNQDIAFVCQAGASTSGINKAQFDGCVALAEGIKQLSLLTRQKVSGANLIQIVTTSVNQYNRLSTNITDIFDMAEAGVLKARKTFEIELVDGFASRPTNWISERRLDKWIPGYAQRAYNKFAGEYASFYQNVYVDQLQEPLESIGDQLFLASNCAAALNPSKTIEETVASLKKDAQKKRARRRKKASSQRSGSVVASAQLNAQLLNAFSIDYTKVQRNRIDDLITPSSSDVPWPGLIKTCEDWNNYRYLADKLNKYMLAMRSAAVSTKSLSLALLNAKNSLIEYLRTAKSFMQAAMQMLVEKAGGGSRFTLPSSLNSKSRFGAGFSRTQLGDSKYDWRYTYYSSWLPFVGKGVQELWAEMAGVTADNWSKSNKESNLTKLGEKLYDDYIALKEKYDKLVVQEDYLLNPSISPSVKSLASEASSAIQTADNSVQLLDRRRAEMDAMVASEGDLKTYMHISTFEDLSLTTCDSDPFFEGQWLSIRRALLAAYYKCSDKEKKGQVSPPTVAVAPAVQRPNTASTNPSIFSPSSEELIARIYSTPSAKIR